MAKCRPWPKVPSAARQQDRREGYISKRCCKEILQSLPRFNNNLHVIPGTRPGGPFVGLDKIWHRIRAAAGLRDVRLHDLRHSFASVAAGGGLSLPVIGALLGHKHAATTARYAHLAAVPLQAANDAVGAKIAAAMQIDLPYPAPKRSA